MQPRNGVTSFAVSRALKGAALVLLGCAVPVFAQDASTAGDTAKPTTTTLFFARTGQSIVTPYVGTIHYLEFIQIRNRWIYPDIGYIDFAHGNYREFFIGGGRTLVDAKKVSWDQELLYVQATGPAAKSARYLQPWSMVRVQFTPKFSNETVYFLYLPINHAARVQNVLERAKFEYALRKHWKIGAGYAAYKFANTRHQNKPLLTTTISTKAGAFEFWLQKIPNGAQVQLRYALIHKSR
jgi:hypothetical protein